MLRLLRTRLRPQQFYKPNGAFIRSDIAKNHAGDSVKPGNHISSTGTTSHSNDSLTSDKATFTKAKYPQFAGDAPAPPSMMKPLRQGDAPPQALHKSGSIAGPSNASLSASTMPSSAKIVSERSIDRLHDTNQTDLSNGVPPGETATLNAFGGSSAGAGAGGAGQSVLHDDDLAAMSASDVLKYPYEVVDTRERLAAVASILKGSKRFSLDIEAFCTPTHQKHLGTISLLQCCSPAAPVVFLVDVVVLGIPAVVEALGPIMQDASIQKLMFDCRRDVEAMSVQMGLRRPAGVLDLQLYFTAIQWQQKSVHRRSGMSFAIKSECGITRQEGDSAVQAAMTLGNRPVWDVRPLPPHFLEYAAGDVRHILLLAGRLVRAYPIEFTARVQRLSQRYVDHYASSDTLVEVEADPKPHDVSEEWLELFVGPGGKCAYCGAKGHTEAECFKRQSNTAKCTHCGEAGHLAKNCYKKFPHLLKCELCGQMGHTATRCFQRNRCVHCGGLHRSENCHQNAKKLRRAEMEAAAAAASGDANAADAERSYRSGP